MPIELRYSPITAGLELARVAGLAQGTLTKEQRVQQLLGLIQGDRAQQAAREAEERAFRLQNALASRRASATSSRGISGQPAMSPAMQRLLSQNALQQQGLQQQQEHLDRLLASGEIDPAAYEKARLGLLSGNDTLVREAIMPRTNEPRRVTPAQELNLLRRPIQDKRRQLQEQLDELEKWRGAPNLSERFGSEEQFRARLDEVTSGLQQLNEKEKTIVAGYKAGTIDPFADGSAAPSSDPYEGKVAVGPQGQRLIRRNGKWEPL